MLENSTVATVLTVYGIETIVSSETKNGVPWFSLQQYLPFTVLKPQCTYALHSALLKLQQYLPFTVLKLSQQTPSFRQAH